MSISELTIVLIQMHFVWKQVNFSVAFKNIGKYILSSSLMFISVKILDSIQNVSLMSLITQIFVGITTFVISIIVVKPTSLSLIKDVVSKRR